VTSALPHNAQIRADVVEYLAEVRDLVRDLTVDCETTSEYRNIYKNCLAADSVLQKLASSRAVPKLTVARGLIQRVPLLIASGQLPASCNELRRFMEIVLWCIYFTDHRIEWTAFARNPSRGFEKDLTTPITFCAFRERTFYSNYAQELFATEESGTALEAAREISRVYGQLNAKVHAAHVATMTRKKPAWDATNRHELSEFAITLNDVAANSCIMLSAFFKSRFDKLPPVHRAWFDWLVGSSRAKLIRAANFGI
jgi:hypothetical protein